MNTVFLDKPHLQKPLFPALVFPTSIILTCEEDVTVKSLVKISQITFECNVFNATDPLTKRIYKDGNLTSYTAPFTIVNPTDDDYGTYTFEVSSEHCGTAIAVTTLRQEGQFK